MDEEMSVGGPSALGSDSQSSLAELDVPEVDDPKLLRALAKKHNIENTKSLVAAYNVTTDRNERGVLLRWLRQYNRRNEEISRAETVFEYAELAKIVPRADQDKRLLRNFVYALHSRLCRCKGEFPDGDFAKALFCALEWVESPVYDDPPQLMVLATDIVSSLSFRPRLTKQNFAQYEANFLALHQTFFLLHTIGRGSLIEAEKKDLRRAVAKKKEEMKHSIAHYPVRFHFELIQQAIERLDVEDDPSRITRAKRYAVSGLYGGIHALHIARKLVGGDVDPAAVEDAYRKSREAIASAGVRHKQWYDLLQVLTAAKLCALKEEAKIELFIKAYEVVMEGQSKTRREEEQKALRYGVIQEIKTLANQGSCASVRQEATTKLIELATKEAVLENWISDSDLLIALFNAVYEIHMTGEHEPRTTEALREMNRCCQEHARETVMSWLDDDTMEDKLLIKRHDETNKECEEMFISIGKDVGYLPLATIRANVEDLKQTYLHDNFAKVPSLFEPVVGKHVKNMKHHVVMYEEIIEKRRSGERKELHDERQEKEKEMESSPSQEEDHPKKHYEQKKKVTTPVYIEDLFRPRSLKAGVLKTGVRKVLLYGNPGSGKTCISKVIAYKWALGEMLQEFEAVNVVPIRSLIATKSKGLQEKTLKEMIARLCFKKERENDEYEDLKAQIDDDLDVFTTLLMFDGLDEADEDAREFLSVAEEHSCKLLFLTRPYNLREIQTRVDFQFECLGFNDKYLRNFIHEELLEEDAVKLITFLQKNPAMWEMAHTPVTAQILCSFSKEHGTAIKERKKRMSMFQNYNDMTSFIWKRFEEKPGAIMANKVAIFQDLEKIAFEALRMGQILIEERIVENCASSTYASRFFKESGFLLLVLEGHEYQFPHLTFQEYFAGRFIASNLKRKGSGKEEERVLKFIQDGKYNQKHALTLSFAMHALAQGQGKSALKDMLSIVDEKPIEVLGVQHFFLKMRVLEATIEKANEDELADLLNDEQAIKLAEGARQLFERTIDDVLIREIVVDEFQQLPRVLEGFPKVLKNSVDEVKTKLKCGQDLTWKERSKNTDVLKLIKHSPKQSNMMMEFTLQLVNTASWCTPAGCMRELRSIAEQLPQYAGEVLPKLKKGCSDEDWDVRKIAVEAIGCVVVAAPQHIGEVLPTLTKGCGDEETVVRQTAIKAIGRVVATAPHHADDVLPMLAELCDEDDLDECIKDWAVRQATIEAIGRVVEMAPQHVYEFLPKLAKGCGDEDSCVRRTAIEAIGRVATKEPQHADTVLPTLVKACFEEYTADMRRMAIESLNCVVAAAAQYTSEVLQMLTKGCGDEDFAVRRAAIEAIAGVVTAAPQHADAVLPTMTKECGDEDFAVRRAAIEAIASVVAAVPQHAEEVLPTLVKGCGDEDSYVRRMAIEAIGHVVETAPLDADKFLPTLVKGCGDEDSYVRRTAIEAIGRVVAKAPGHAGEVLPMLAEGCGDEKWAMRRASIEAIASVVAAAPQYVDEFLPMLASGCGDEDSYVRRTAIEAIGRVVARTPGQAGEVLPMLAEGCGNEKWDVREAATEALGRVVAAALHHADKVLPMLAKLCDDEDSYVRRAAIEASGRVVASAPGRAGEVLPMLSKGYGHEDSNMRDGARTALKNIKPEEVLLSAMSFPSTYEGGLVFFFVRNSFTIDPIAELKEVSIVLHTFASEEIGKWDKNAIDVFVEYLKREFDKKFPALLKHL